MNLAYKKPSIQSGKDFWNFPSNLGNDGDRNGDLLNGRSCIQTATVNAPLWSVDLQANYSIAYVRFSNWYYGGNWSKQDFKMNLAHLILYRFYLN